MLHNTFCHIQGIGAKTEAQLWQAGIRHWDDLPTTAAPPLSAARMATIHEKVDEARTQLADGRADYFIKTLPPREHWRIFPHFRDSIAYLDIETTGLNHDLDHITTIALYDGGSIRHYVYNDNLDDFVADLAAYTVLVTYNGKCFDLPFLERFFRIKITQAHIDLRYILAGLGLRGGLKGCEAQLGLDRGDLQGVDGFFAVLLWQEYQKTGNRQALETLLAYNIQDVVNLEPLMIEAYNRNLAGTPFDNSHRLQPPGEPVLPFVPDKSLVQRLRPWNIAGRTVASTARS